MTASLTFPDTVRVSHTNWWRMTETYQVIPHCHITNLVKALGVYGGTSNLHDTSDSSRMLYPCLMRRRTKKLSLRIRDPEERLNAKLIPRRKLAASPRFEYSQKVDCYLVYHSAFFSVHMCSWTALLRTYPECLWLCRDILMRVLESSNVARRRYLLVGQPPRAMFLCSAVTVEGLATLVIFRLPILTQPGLRIYSKDWETRMAACL